MSQVQANTHRGKAGYNKWGVAGVACLYNSRGLRAFEAEHLVVAEAVAGRAVLAEVEVFHSQKFA